MSTSDLSSLSSLSPAPSTDDEVTSVQSIIGKKSTLTKNGSPVAKLRTTPTRPKRPASPPHEYVLADNPDIAFIVMFRSRFSDAFPKTVPHFGPQDIERGVVEPSAGDQVEHLLCALLSLVLNRKKHVERGHYGRALEDAIQTQKSQWPLAWNGISPLSGGKTFQTMSPTEQLTILRTLILWSLNTSETVTNIIKESYKQSRHNDDLNQPLSVQPWGRDVDKRRYWLIEGQDDTHFRLYRESNPVLKHNSWWSVAGTIEELKTVAAKLGEEGSQAGKRLSDRILAAVPRFEASEEKRRRREYRQSRRAQFVRPEPGFSLYEGRTRGKRMRYTFSDEEDDGSDARSTRRSARSTPAEQCGPTITASGRQVRSRFGGAYGEAPLSGQNTSRASPATGEYEGSEASEEPRGVRTRLRASGLRNELDGRPKKRKVIDDSDSVDDMEDDREATPSGGEWEGGDDEEDEAGSESNDGVEDEEGDSEDGLDGRPRKSLMVTLKYRKKGTELEPKPEQNIHKGADHIPTESNGRLEAPSSLDLKHLETAPLKTSSPPQLKVQAPTTTHEAPSYAQGIAVANNTSPYWPSHHSSTTKPQMRSQHLPNGYPKVGEDAAQPSEKPFLPELAPWKPSIATPQSTE